MLLKILDCQRTNGRFFVRAANEIGEFMGIWCSDQLPLVGADVFAEINIPMLTYAQITVVDNFTPSVSINGGAVSFVGRCEAIDDIYVIRFAADWLTMVEIEGADGMINEGDMIAFSVDGRQIEIFPYD